MVKRYLKLATLEEALLIIREAFPPMRFSETVAVEDSVGRISAGAVFASYSVPEVFLSAMDGIAVSSRDTRGASEQNPVALSDALRVNTGNVVPRGYDAVIMIEDVWEEEGCWIIRKPVAPWQHIRPAGEDIAETEMIIPSFHRIRPHDTGALATYGVTRIPVLTLRVGIIPTGSELVAPGTRPAPGQVVESNTLMASAWLSSLGARCTRYPITPDDPDEIRRVITLAAEEQDMVVVSAGSSAGTKDYTVDVIASLGEVLLHGVSIKPGKPVIVGNIGGKPVMGMPGYPLSAVTVLREIATPLLAHYGLTPPDPVVLTARLTQTLHSDVGTDEFVLLSVGKIRGEWVASPQSRGSGVQMSGVRSNAYLRIPNRTEGFESGEMVRVNLMVPPSVAEAALLVTGSHDPALDHLADMIRPGGVVVHSTHAGSMGGVLALKRNDCHAAPMHLLSPAGEYNVPFIQRYLPGEDIALVTIADREQGIVSRDGLSLEDLPGHSFVNRQKGSGTRILLDYELQKRGIDPAAIQGYDREVTTHTAVALAVRSGEVDAGMCVYSAAKAYGLPFVPVASERYELAIREEELDDPRIATLLDAVRSDRFRTVLTGLGGYDTRLTGTLHRVPR
ncbi:putative molybdopterin biosynthesis protein [Methanolinea mesophila]|uniref:molybdopterin biosynthesis protein n=1 Tax=Methanolinea mesophila TaxID=547055 RepID=UPI001AE1143C|nr:molybdopterin biosynthesis protein [Methanolinea mesophila]MBP1929865.1 putative molybdopterin biosynthesis protein [Methanolinea mesophila]